MKNLWKFNLLLTFFIAQVIGAQEPIECLENKGRWDYPTSPLAKKIAKAADVKTCNGQTFKSIVRKYYPEQKIITSGKSEDSYNVRFCKKQKGKIEQDNIDCLTNEYAIEVDRAKKWREAIGQSLHYAYQSKKKPGIALIASGSTRDKNYINKLQKVIAHSSLDIKIWIIEK